MQIPTLHNQKFTYILCICFGIFFGSGSIFMYQYMWMDAIESDVLPTQERSHKYEFIQPLMECENSNKNITKRYIPFEKKLKEDIIAYQEKFHPTAHMSFYFRDLQNGPWFSNNHEEGFYPASLLKMPILIGYIKWAEGDHNILKQKLTVEDLGGIATQNYKPEYSAKVGTEYTVEELLELMILYSDNNASNNLFAHLPESIERDIFETFQIPSPKNETAESYKLNVKEYASFFRILFNASYLSNEGSEAALNLLSKVSFNRGITGKLPKTIKVAHKFGERVYSEIGEDGKEKSTAQLHDCGIVYYPGHPYLLCIMTRGDTLDELSAMTQDISKIIYDTVESTQQQSENPAYLHSTR